MKVLGVLSILSGIFFIFFFPEIEEFEFGPFTRTAIMVGIALIGIGLYLLYR